jgi:dephospho-CoA kinase
MENDYDKERGKDKVVIALIGMPGSGKTEVSKVISEETRACTVVMGDIIREETVKRGFELNPENMGFVSVKLRKEYGDDVIAKRCIEKIQEIKNNIVIVEGVRSLAEIRAFKEKIPNFYTIVIETLQKTRFERLKKRGRPDDSISWEIFVKRDERELGFGLGNAIELADFCIVNEKDDLEAFKENVRKTIRSLINQIKEEKEREG